MDETETIEPNAPVKKNKGGRPRKAVAPQFTDEQFSQLLAVLASNKTDGPAGVDLTALQALLEGTAKVSAQAMQKALKPENETHPGLSAFSYPEGDVAHPRPALRWEVWWNAFPIHKFQETHHYLELELLNQLEPGTYPVLRRDGTADPEPIQVKGTRDADGRVVRLDVTFSVPRQERHSIAPMTVMLYQMVHHEEPLRQSFMAGWRLWMETIMAAPAAA